MMLSLKEEEEELPLFLRLMKFSELSSIILLLLLEFLYYCFSKDSSESDFFNFFQVSLTVEFSIGSYFFFAIAFT